MLIEELTTAEQQYMLHKRSANKIQELEAVIQGLLKENQTLKLEINDLTERLNNVTAKP
jgi:regulator of replication initiation timing